MNPTEPQVVPAAIADLIHAFEHDLGEASFPGVDASTLKERHGIVEACAAAVASGRVQLAAAEAELTVARDELVRHARLALSYARVFAQDNEELGARLEALAIASDLRAPKRRATAAKTKRRRADVRVAEERGRRQKEERRQEEEPAQKGEPAQEGELARTEHVER